MKIWISSNFKKHYSTSIDFLEHTWINFFEKEKHNFVIIPNSIKNLEKILLYEKKPDLIILPGGNDLIGKDKLTKVRLKVEKKLIRYSINKKIALLGVCRGMQVINSYFGGRIKIFLGHMNVKTKIFFKEIFFKQKTLKVKCFHNYCIKNKSTPREFEIIATDKDKNVEMFKHKQKKIIGVMWHPERETNYIKLNFIIKRLLDKK
ncbi:gamma-glutamyl-gamma-aminobutyrate hydrolase family protein [Candidatus Pelagibacter sp.]|nr:gamma-glutamyl-gamma-aminobutyrate hydrolase family protein [Candidatus Pelagibacter sp.]